MPLEVINLTHDSSVLVFVPVLVWIIIVTALTILENDC